MVHSPSKHRSKKSKRRGEDTRDVSQQQKRQKAGTQLPIGPGSSLAHQPRRSNRTGAGTGGHAIQLERIGAAVEGPQRVSRPRTTLSADIAQNPIAPPRDKNRKKKLPQRDPDPDRLYVSATVNPALSQPHFYASTDGNRFGFYERTHLVPPGTEPDLQALNNPYIAARREQERQLAASRTPQSTSASSSGDVAHQPLPLLDSRTSSSRTRPQNFFLPDQIDPSLRGPAGSWQVGQDDGAASNGDRNMNSQEDDDGYEGNTDDRSSEDSDEEAEPRRQHAPKRLGTETQATRMPRHVSPPLEDDFEFSRDEAEENAHALLRGYMGEPPTASAVDAPGPQNEVHQPVDVLDRHHQRNGHPRAPDPAMLSALQGQSATMIEGDNAIDDDPPRRAPRRPRRARDELPPPNQIGHYGPVWKDCLEEAKIECRAVHALSNPWPKLKIDSDSLTDSLATVVMEWSQRGVRFEPGCWPEKQEAMTQLLYEDMSTWRSEMKKVAVVSTALLYKLEPGTDVGCTDHVAFAQNAATELLQQSMFLRDGTDENDKTRNFAHPALKDALIKFFYTGSYRIAHRRPEIFRSRIPNTCLVAICTALNCVLDGYARNGTGKSLPKFSAKAYASIYNGLLALIEETLRHPYHGPRLAEQLGRWAREGWAELQQIDISVERHDHLQISLD